MTWKTLVNFAAAFLCRVLMESTVPNAAGITLMRIDVRTP